MRSCMAESWVVISGATFEANEDIWLDELGEIKEEDLCMGEGGGGGKLAWAETRDGRLVGDRGAG